MMKESLQIGISLFVIDDKTGIDREIAPHAGDGNCIRMSADAAIAFIDRNLMALA